MPCKPFPLHLGPATIMSEESMERAAERFMDRLDRVFMNDANDMTQREYDGYVAQFRAWEKDCDRLRQEAWRLGRDEITWCQA